MIITISDNMKCIPLNDLCISRHEFYSSVTFSNQYPIEMHTTRTFCGNSGFKNEVLDTATDKKNAIKVWL